MEQGYFISRNIGLYIFSKMITQLLQRMKSIVTIVTYKVADAEKSHWRELLKRIQADILSQDLSPENCMLFHSFLLPGTDREQRIYEK